MDTQEALRMALQALWTNKLRTVLTLLGVVIGVASVIAVMTLVNGAKVYVATKVNNQGADVFTVSQQPSLVTSYNDYIKFGKRKIISLDDYRAVAAECTQCLRVGAFQGTSGKVKYGNNISNDAAIRGTTTLMVEMQNVNIVEGRTFTQTEEDHAMRVAVIGADIEDNVIKSVDGIGKEIRVDGVPYTVIGIGEKKGKTLGTSQDNWVILPITAAQKTYGSAKSVVIYAEAGSGPIAKVAASDQARQIMRSIRHDRPGDDDSFTVETSNSFVGLLGTILNLFGGVAVAIATISLLVGGIVIMNIMLVSVTERTREIGVRKALGARGADIQKQFLMESATMALIGGAGGVVLGVGVAKIVTILLGFPSALAVWSIFAGLIVSTCTGIFFGVYPARKASALDPIVALRSEF